MAPRLSFEEMAAAGAPTFQANCGAAGFSSYVVGYFALIQTGVVLLQLGDVNSGRGAFTDHLMFSAVLQGSLVFVPVHLERCGAIHLTVEAGIFSWDALYWTWSLNKGWGLWKIYRKVINKETLLRNNRRVQTLPSGHTRSH